MKTNHSSERQSILLFPQALTADEMREFYESSLNGLSGLSVETENHGGLFPNDADH